MGNIRGSVVVVASLTLVVGCSLGAESEGPSTVTVTSSSSTPQTQTETTTATQTPTSSSPSSPSSSAPDPTTTSSAPDVALPTGVGPYTDGFVQAWGIGDRSAASSYATTTAVSSLFAYDGRGGSSWTRGAATEQGNRTQVKYTDGTGQTLYVLVDTAAAQQGSANAVVGANPEWEDTHETVPAPDDWDIDTPASGLPSTVTEYADAFVRAWGVDAVSMDDYASDDVVTTLYTDYGSGGSNWSRSASTSSTVTYSNTDGSTLVLSLDAATVSAGSGEGIIGATIS